MFYFYQEQQQQQLNLNTVVPPLVWFVNQAWAPACCWNPSSWSTHVCKLALRQEKEMVGLEWEGQKKECY